MENNFGHNLTYLRMRKEMTQKELAEEFCMTQQAVGRLERGSNEPRLATLIMAADYFNVSIDDLIYRDLKHEGRSEAAILRRFRLFLKNYGLGIDRSTNDILIAKDGRWEDAIDEFCKWVNTINSMYEE